MKPDKSLTQAELNRRILMQPQSCPFCLSYDTSPGECPDYRDNQDTDGKPEYVLVVECNKCGKIYQEVYKLVGAEELG